MTVPPLPAPAFAAYALNVALEATAVCLVALVAARVFARNDSSLRYAICLGGLVCVLLSPLLPSLLGRVGYGLIRISLPASPPTSAANRMATATLPAARRRLVGLRLYVRRPQPRPTPAWGVWTALFVWAVGATRATRRFLRGCRQASRLRRGAPRLDAAQYADALERLQRALGTVVPPILISSRIEGPVAVGIWSGAVILPEGLAETLTPEQLRHVLLHECAHVALRHGLGGLAQRLADLLFWPHPLVRALGRELALAREEVCDNVASQEDGAACYARTLLAVAEGVSTAPQLSSVLALLGPGPSLEDRIAGLLDPRRNRMVGVTRGKLWAVTAALVVTMASSAAVRVVADGTQSNGKGSATVRAEDKNGAQRVTCRLVRLTLNDGEVVRALKQDVTGAQVRLMLDDGKAVTASRLNDSPTNVTISRDLPRTGATPRSSKANSGSVAYVVCDRVTDLSSGSKIAYELNLYTADKLANAKPDGRATSSRVPPGSPDARYRFMAPPSRDTVSLYANSVPNDGRHFEIDGSAVEPSLFGDARESLYGVSDDQDDEELVDDTYVIADPIGNSGVTLLPCIPVSPSTQVFRLQPAPSGKGVAPKQPK